MSKTPAIALCPELRAKYPEASENALARLQRALQALSNAELQSFYDAQSELAAHWNLLQAVWRESDAVEDEINGFPHGPPYAPPRYTPEHPLWDAALDE